MMIISSKRIIKIKHYIKYLRLNNYENLVINVRNFASTKRIRYTWAHTQALLRGGRKGKGYKKTWMC